MTPEQDKLIEMFEKLRRQFEHAIVGVALAQVYMQDKQYERAEETLNQIMQGPEQP